MKTKAVAEKKFHTLALFRSLLFLLLLGRRRAGSKWKLKSATPKKKFRRCSDSPWPLTSETEELFLFRFPTRKLPGDMLLLSAPLPPPSRPLPPPLSLLFSLPSPPPHSSSSSSSSLDFALSSLSPPPGLRELPLPATYMHCMRPLTFVSLFFSAATTPFAPLPAPPSILFPLSSLSFGFSLSSCTLACSTSPTHGTRCAGNSASLITLI